MTFWKYWASHSTPSTWKCSHQHQSHDEFVASEYHPNYIKLETIPDTNTENKRATNYKSSIRRQPSPYCHYIKLRWKLDPAYIVEPVSMYHELAKSMEREREGYHFIPLQQRWRTHRCNPYKLAHLVALTANSLTNNVRLEKRSTVIHVKWYFFKILCQLGSNRLHTSTKKHGERTNL